MDELVKVESFTGWGELVLNRPQRKNSLIGPLVEQLIVGLESLERDSNVGAVLIRGAGGCFCAGLDLQAFRQEPPPPWREHFSDRWLELHERLWRSSLPTIGALEGHAIAGGSGLALACDFLVAGSGAVLHVKEAELGMPAPMNVAWLRLRHGYSLALELAVLAEPLNGRQLLDRGLVARCVDDDRVVSEARALAERLASLSAESHASTLRTLRALESWPAATEQAVHESPFALARRAAALHGRTP